MQKNRLIGLTPLDRKCFYKLSIKGKHYLTGFTLIELLVTITIIGLLIATVAINYEKVRIRGRDSKRKGDIVNVANALESFYLYNKVYPDSQCSPYSDRSWVDCFGTNQPWIKDPTLGDLTPYLDPMPIEPKIVGSNGGNLLSAGCFNVNEYNYLYQHSSSLESYLVATRLENIYDTEAFRYDDNNPTTSIDTDCSSQPQYQVTLGTTIVDVFGYPIYLINK